MGKPIIGFAKGVLLQIGSIGFHSPYLACAVVLVDEDQSIRIAGSTECRGIGPIDVVGPVQTVASAARVRNFCDRETRGARIEPSAKDEVEVEAEYARALVAQDGLGGIAGARIDVFKFVR